MGLPTPPHLEWHPPGASSQKEASRTHAFWNVPLFPAFRILPKCWHSFWDLAAPYCPKQYLFLQSRHCRPKDVV